MAALFFITVLMIGAVDMKSLYQVQKRSTKCYEHLGCFSSSAPFTSVQRLLSVPPASPDVIRTEFRLYTRESRTLSQNLDARQMSTLYQRWTHFKSSRPTKIIVHGFVDDVDLSAWMKQMKNEFLANGDYNVILTDWSKGNLPPYTQATANTRVVGAQIALMVKQLISAKGVSLDDVHIIGHSLGAHICGYAGERLPGLARITGLDPAGPYFENTDKVVRLDPTDAKFVDVIHSDAESLLTLGLGLKQQVGHADFYPNLGHDQPGCTRNPITQISQNGLIEGISNVVACHHLRSYKYFSESINTRCPYTGIACNNEDDFANHKCTKCSGDSCMSMGLKAKKPSGMKKYYLWTASRNPYCQYSLEVAVKLGNGATDERGTMSVIISGDKGKTNKIQLHKDPMVFRTARTYKFHVGVSHDIGKLESVTFSWNHDSTLTNPLHWNILGLRHPKLVVDEIEISSPENEDDARFCTHSQRIETDVSMSFSNRC